ncbi:DUF1501 domain-containing protein [Paraburkholderia phymatum]|uniref:Twin-arginine translocation pathway signal sequence domain-containing protein n=1 Tax=Paraburkholderia phymatum (strain DSM 17167 / CIP 108236 / LMG 21445 / STM815) TaxID=391038 RepID=B2JGK9_PARP8|nr:DUF1501 domain-containing protein [Paraburkholderia phymatum]ACC70194.1 protein of unknown function DUF1501 [Paraburkholderia phymatum STM815]
MKRRDFISMAAAAGASLSVSRVFATPQTGGGILPQLHARKTARDAFGKLLILIELKGGNDGLNTVIPFTDSRYYALRTHIAIPRNRGLAIDGRTALHPAMRELLPLWRDGQLAVVQGVGCGRDDASHFRSTEIWHTASRADEYRRDGWLTRVAVQCGAVNGRFAAASFGSDEPGPFAQLAHRCGDEHSWSRVDDPDTLAHVGRPDVGEGAGDRVPGTTLDAAHAGVRLFRDSIAAALRTVDMMQPHMRGAIRVTLDGFDTHRNQLTRHAALLAQLAGSCATLREELVRRGRWHDTLVMTYSEFGRSARENVDRGTEHGGAAAHFVMGGGVRGGVYGQPPDLTRLDADGRLPVEVDFRRLYATALASFWKLDANAVLRDAVQPLPLMRV